MLQYAHVLVATFALPAVKVVCLYLVCGLEFSGWELGLSQETPLELCGAVYSITTFIGD